MPAFSLRNVAETAPAVGNAIAVAAAAAAANGVTDSRTVVTAIACLRGTVQS